MRNWAISLIACLAAQSNAPTRSYAQGLSANWFFGQQAGLTFNGAGPASMVGSSMIAAEGCTAMSNPSGDLLFYTDGITVWNALHQPMAGGTGLLSASSSTMAATVVPKPCSTTEYYLFTVPDQLDMSVGLRFSIIDMSLASGLGSVTTSNVLLFQPSTERVCAIRHANGQDVWILAHAWGSDAFHAYLISSAGVNPTPVISNVGSVHTGNAWNSAGYMKGSPDGTKVAVAIGIDGVIELFSFDNTSGVISQPVQVTLPGIQQAYSLEFSPNSNLLYATNADSGTFVRRLYQLPLDQGWNSAAIQSGTTMVGATGSQPGVTPEAIQAGPDGRIYVGNRMRSWLGAVLSPNTPGAACNYVDSVVTIGGTCYGGLPNFVNDHALQASFNATGFCLGTQTTFQAAAWLNPDSVHWSFGDGTASTVDPVSHTYSQAGAYSVTLTTWSGGSAELFTRTITILPSANGPFLGADTMVCAAGQWILDATTPCAAYLWHDGSTLPTFNVSGPGTYWVTVDGPCGVASDTLTVAWGNAAAVIDLGNDTTLCSGASLTLSVNSLNVLWSTGSAIPSIIVNDAGTYWVDVTTACGNVSDTIVVQYTTPPALDLGADTTLCDMASWTLDATSTSATYLWHDGSNLPTFNVSGPGTYWVTVDGPCGTFSDTVHVELDNALVIDLGNDTTLCAGTPLTLSVNSTDVLWSTGSTSASILVSAAGTYWVEVAGNCGSVADTIAVLYQAPPVVNLGPDTAICPGDTLVLSVDDAYPVEWSTGSFSSQLHVVEPGTYVVQVHAGPCAANDAVTITLASCAIPGIYVPNAFTPNGDGFNDLFQVVSLLKPRDFVLRIFDRWGEVVFETEEIEGAWDGTSHGKPVPIGVYPYKIDFFPRFGFRREFFGHVSLVR